MGTEPRLGVGRAVGGLLLVVVGVLLLLQNLGVMGDIPDPVWPLVFAAAGIAFLAAFVSNPANVWALIPGFGLLGLAGTTGLHSFAPWLEATWGGSLFLGGLGLGFLAWYVARRDDWWAIIPAGVLLTLAAVAWAPSAFRGRDTGGVFFLGLALTFVVVYLLPNPKTRTGRRQRRSWALIAAVPLFALAVVVFGGSASVFKYLWPALLILAGIWLVLRSTRQRPVIPFPRAAPEARLDNAGGSDERPPSAAG